MTAAGWWLPKAVADAVSGGKSLGECYLRAREVARDDTVEKIVGERNDKSEECVLFEIPF